MTQWIKTDGTWKRNANVVSQYVFIKRDGVWRGIVVPAFGVYIKVAGVWINDSGTP